VQNGDPFDALDPQAFTHNYRAHLDTFDVITTGLSNSELLARIVSAMTAFKNRLDQAARQGE
jgi:hypothetical protein